jgi:hypothetical protein
VACRNDKKLQITYGRDLCDLDMLLLVRNFDLNLFVFAALVSLGPDFFRTAGLRSSMIDLDIRNLRAAKMQAHGETHRGTQVHK